MDGTRENKENVRKTCQYGISTVFTGILEPNHHTYHYKHF